MKRSFPIHATGGEIRNLKQPGYYPGFSTLAQKKTWDEATQHTVMQRVTQMPPVRFFTEAEAEVLKAVLDRVLPQDDRAEEQTIALLPSIDQRLFKNELNGYRFEDMPPDQEAYRMALRAIDEMAVKRFGGVFAELPVHRQELLLQSLHDGKPDPEHAVWKQMPVKRFWALLMEDAVTAYYSHPWAWDEIGFGGPAYPRGYMRLEEGEPEPWEEDESRYEWNAPADTVSDSEEPPGSGDGRQSHPGQGGTH